MKKTAFNLRLSQAWLPPKILLIMKLIIIIMTACLMQVSAAGFAQKITYSKKGATLEQIFSEIRKQTGYYVVYAENKVNKEARLDVNFRNTELNKVLDVISNSQNLEYSLDDKNISLKPKEESVIDRIIARFQAIDVRGKVVDSLGNGLPGATVSIKNGKGSTSTAANGDFYMKNVEEGAILVISYLGYITKEQSASKEFNYVILQQSTSQLDEVLVQTYGTTTRRLSTGNVAMITSKEISQQNINNPLLALQGRVAGVEVITSNGLPGAPVNIKIRGEYSLRDEGGGNEPLIVIDGVPQANNIAGLGSIAGGGSGTDAGKMSAFSFVNPNEIESISVLKDADATSIYGSRGSKGVILINTKKGKAGETSVDVILNTGWQDVAKKLNLLNTEQYIEMRREGLKNANRISRLDDPSVYAGVYPDLLVWDQKQYTDWQKVLIGNTATYTDIQGNVSGGTNNMQYRLGGTYHNEAYVFPGESYDQKGTANLSVMGASTNQKFRSMFSASYTFNKNSLLQEDLTRYAMSLSPNAPNLYLTNGDLNWGANTYSPGGEGTWLNPFSLLERPNSQKVNNLISNAALSYEIIPGLFIKTAMGYNKLAGRSFIIVNNLASTDPAVASSYGSFLRMASFMDSSSESWSVEPQLTYNKKIRIGLFEALLGGSLQSQKASTDQIQGYGFNSDAVMQSLSQATGYQLIGNTLSEYKYNAVFARLNYNLNDKYLVNVSARRDGSSRFGPGRQFGNFWSVGSAWIFTQENLVKYLAPFLSFGKMKFSYGTSGNDGIGDYQFFELYTPVVGIESYRGIKLLSSSGLSNSNFGWENVKKMEFGIDLSFFADRLNLSGSYFRNRSSNLLGTYSLPDMAGPGSLRVNQPALIQTMGWEFLINSSNVTKTNFSWESSLNIGFLRNKRLADFEGGRTDVGVGKPFYGFTSAVVFNGVDPVTGQYQFLGKDGSPTFLPEDAARKEIRIQPLFSGGFNNAFIYKNFSLNVFLQFVKQHGKNYLFQFQQPPGLAFNQPIEVMDRWRTSGDKNRFQRFFAGGTSPVSAISVTNAYNAVRDQSDISWVDASFVRLKTVSLSYNLTRFAKQELHLKNLRFFAQAQNLYTWTNYKGTDPETQNPYILPPLRTITAGIQLTL
ncbi:SusC/RagA family TonB-linked outer membrane protein [Pedobacter deserti]|uniref:SusC/RagA family TonB-linked outer membrane protein n=1 Tax=Pedobacter deserti TaxID=2817382 RepID=UPI00210D8A99|nr:SusC/RagA family TonB-linked outer membrane protein [Pedobacter sp. SYSU D00382]